MTDKERLTEVIKSSKMSTKRFSEHIGLKTPQVLYDIINERNGISKDLADKITAKCLNYNLAWLLTGEGEMIKRDDDKITNTEDKIDINKLIESNSSLVQSIAKIVETNSMLAAKIIELTK